MFFLLKFIVETLFFFSGSRAPFNIRFVSDHYEFAGEAARPGVGAKLNYILKPC